MPHHSRRLMSISTIPARLGIIPGIHLGLMTRGTRHGTGTTGMDLRGHGRGAGVRHGLGVLLGHGAGVHRGLGVRHGDGDPVGDHLGAGVPVGHGPAVATMLLTVVVL